MSNKYWFKRKLYGWGWSPSSWEGWVVVGVFLAVIVVIASSFDTTITILEAIGLLAVPVLLLLAICYMTGEKPHWQWGHRDDNMLE